MEVSVFVITYNQEKYIRQCLDSILIQKCNFDFELIISDDCSKDKTQDVCIEYARKFNSIIKLIHNQKNVGIIKNYFNTIQKCRGKYIAFCAGDDYWCDIYKLQKQYDYMQSRTEKRGGGKGGERGKEWEREGKGGERERERGRMGGREREGERRRNHKGEEARE